MTWSQKSFQMLFLFIAFLLCSYPGHANPVQAPEVLMKEVSEQMLAALREERERIHEHPEYLFELVDKTLRPHVDLDRMSGWVMGKYWRQTTVEQRKRFSAAFSALMIRFYTAALLEDPRQLDKLLDRKGELITFKPSRPAEKQTTTVRSEVHLDDGKTVQVLFSVHNRDGDWKVYDVSVEGVSLVTNYRTSFAQEISQVGIDGLITRLEERNQALLEQVANSGSTTE